MSLPEGAPGSRTTYQIEITAREKEAFERFFEGSEVTGDESLRREVGKRIADLPKKVVAAPKSEE